MQVTSNKAVAILGIGARVSSAKAGADTIDVVRSAEVRIKVGAKVGIATVGEIGRTGLII
jgi:hypothetical protein